MSNTMPTARTRGPGWTLAVRMLTILGAIATFLGLFAMFGDEDISLGLGGDLSWKIGEISDAWVYGQLIVGGILLLGALYMAIAGRSRVPVASTPRGDLVTHAVVYVVVNAFVWLQDLAFDGGLDYAYWVTIPWGIGLIAHIVSAVRWGQEDITTQDDTRRTADEQKELQPH